VDGIAAEPQYLDISVPPGRQRTLPIETTRHAFAYVFAGEGIFGDASAPRAVQTDLLERPDLDLLDHTRLTTVGNRSLVLFDRGDEIRVQAGEQGVRFLLVSGRPIEEPVAWYGPIVMNTADEIRQAFAEYRNGTFLREPDQRR
jgi:redox-sensitive bicupin YhaK (pirin superfamily)